MGSECFIDTIADGEMNRMKALYSNTKRRMTTAFFIMICLCLVLFVEGALAEAPGTGRALADRKAELIQMMNLNLRYILQTWWHAEKDFVYAAATSFTSDPQLTEERILAIQNSARTFADWRNSDLSILYLSREQAENGIRPVSHAVYCISLALYYGYYDSEITGVSAEDAEAMCVRLISAVTGEHRANHPEAMDDRYWGDSWQSPLWAENIGLGAWLLRDRMDPEIYAKA